MVDSETNSLGLGNVQRFKVLTEGWLHFRGILLIGLWNPCISIGGPRKELACEGKSLDANDFVMDSVNNSREVERVSIVV